MWHEGKQLYLGGFGEEHWAARAHDVMAVRCRGIERAVLNFDAGLYAPLLSCLEGLSEDDVTTVLRSLSRLLRTGLCEAEPTAPEGREPPPPERHHHAPEGPTRCDA